MPHNARQILIVDDNQDIRSLLKLTLVNQGYVCHAADGAEAALKFFSERSVDLALIDIVMGGMTGLSLFKQIRDNYPETAIIFVTSIDDMELALDTVKQGAYDYIIKSAIPDRLVETVEQAISWRDANVERNRRLGDLQILSENQVVTLSHNSQQYNISNQTVRRTHCRAPEDTT